MAPAAVRAQGRRSLPPARPGLDAGRNRRACVLRRAHAGRERLFGRHAAGRIRHPRWRGSMCHSPDGSLGCGGIGPHHRSGAATEDCTRRSDRPPFRRSRGRRGALSYGNAHCYVPVLMQRINLCKGPAWRQGGWAIMARIGGRPRRRPRAVSNSCRFCPTAGNWPGCWLVAEGEATIGFCLIIAYAAIDRVLFTLTVTINSNKKETNTHIPFTLESHRLPELLLTLTVAISS